MPGFTWITPYSETARRAGLPAELASDNEPYRSRGTGTVHAWMGSYSTFWRLRPSGALPNEPSSFQGTAFRRA